MFTHPVVVVLRVVTQIIILNSTLTKFGILYRFEGHLKDYNLIRLSFKNQGTFLEYSKYMFPGTTHHGVLLLDKIMIYICTAFLGANWCE